MNLQKLDDLAHKSGMPVAEYLKEIICRGWQAFYEIKTYATTPAPKKKDNSMDILAKIYNELED